MKSGMDKHVGGRMDHRIKWDVVGGRWMTALSTLENQPASPHVKAALWAGLCNPPLFTSSCWPLLPACPSPCKTAFRHCFSDRHDLAQTPKDRLKDSDKNTMSFIQTMHPHWLRSGRVCLSLSPKQVRARLSSCKAVTPSP